MNSVSMNYRNIKALMSHVNFRQLIACPKKVQAMDPCVFLEILEWLTNSSNSRKQSLGSTTSATFPLSFYHFQRMRSGCKIPGHRWSWSTWHDQVGCDSEKNSASGERVLCLQNFAEPRRDEHFIDNRLKISYSASVYHLRMRLQNCLIRNELMNHWI